MIILGLHFGHDGTACIVENGKLKYALATERFNRSKKFNGITPESLDYVLAGAGIGFDQVDVIALSDWNSQYSHGALEGVYKGDEEILNTWNSIFGDEVLELKVKMRGREIPAYNIGHHMAHCAAAYYTSPFTEAMCFSMDSSGGDLRANSVVAHGVGTKLNFVRCPGLMIGLAYGQFTEKLGLGNQMHKAGSMMGLAAYGRPSDRVRTAMDAYVYDAFFDLSTGIEYWRWVDELWSDLSGARGFFDGERSDKQVAMDIAATMQLIFEEAILKGIADIPNEADIPNLCLGGGSFLNCNVNSRIVRESRYKNVHLFPACSDDGGAVGAALFVSHHILGEERCYYTPGELAYLGPGHEFNDEHLDLEPIAEALSHGKIVAWFQGRSEFGPRALGNRSILADPRSKTHRDKINFEIKKREWFRPFAPSVINTKCSDYFEWEGESPFMLMTAKVRNPDLIPAVTHVDGTARMQTVDVDVNPLYFCLISEFQDRTGIPMLLNTSLNGPGEPILETEADCWRFWKNCPVDMMVINGRVYSR